MSKNPKLAANNNLKLRWLLEEIFDDDKDIEWMEEMHPITAWCTSDSYWWLLKLAKHLKAAPTNSIDTIAKVAYHARINEASRKDVCDMIRLIISTEAIENGFTKNGIIV